MFPSTSSFLFSLDVEGISFPQEKVASFSGKALGDLDERATLGPYQPSKFPGKGKVYVTDGQLFVLLDESNQNYSPHMKTSSSAISFNF